MLFAAGFGTRMGALTANTPKPLVKVAGKALIDHTLDLARKVDPATIVANTHYLSNQIERHLEGTSVVVSNETPNILETGGGLRQALPLLDSNPVFTSNTDAIWHGPNPFQVALDAWYPDVMDALLVCVPPGSALGHKGQGDFTLAENGLLKRGPGVIYGGVQILRTDGLFDIEQAAFSLNRLWDRILANGRLFGVSYSGKWCDVGSPEGIILAENLLSETDV
ncbi:MurNAc alpha-1-phosphate uridylyltransferase [Shimia isoporae]|uniref:MurNAc alpha-1-phosphate uridylyltransferase n=2 Tax=Shimia isoporae TaxID=647720 RepID=A0A4R1N9K2_9RHOB|nr:MurNAc alpha-1-phosphate uridylyltransferase [Shimia isoporae]